MTPTSSPASAGAPALAAALHRETGPLVADPDDALRRLRAAKAAPSWRGAIFGAVAVVAGLGSAFGLLQGATDLRQRLAMAIAPELGDPARSAPLPRYEAVNGSSAPPAAPGSVPRAPEPGPAPLPVLRALPARVAAPSLPVLPGLAPTVDPTAVLAAAPLAQPRIPLTAQVGGAPGDASPPSLRTVAPAPSGHEAGEMVALVSGFSQSTPRPDSSGPDFPRPAAPGRAVPGFDAGSQAAGRPAVSGLARQDIGDLPAQALAPPVVRPAVEEVAPAPAVLNVVVHHPPDAAARAAAVAEGLRDAGLDPTRVVPVTFSISRSNLRYYHIEDADAAKALALDLAPDLEARDFTDYRPSPPPGTIEIWLAGTGPTEAAPAWPGPGQAGPVPAARSQGTEADAQARLQAQVERLLRGQIETLAR